MTMRAATDAIFGYLISGFLILAACEAAYDGSWLFEGEWQPESIAVFAAIAGGAGCLISRLSRIFVEQKLLHGCLTAPQEVLLSDHPHGDRSWKQALFPTHYQPLPQETRDRLATIAERDGLHGSGSALFLHALAAVQEQPAIMRRILMYRQLSGICRSLCVGLVAVAAILVSGMIWHSVYATWGQSDLRKLGYCLLSLFEAAGMVYRYLKFDRQYVMGVLTGYAELRERG